MIVGFQGEAGAFSEEAALALLGPVQTRGYRTFDDLVEVVTGGDVTYGLLPCENTITGSIVRAYDLLAQHPSVKIVDETVHRIEQCLIGLPGTAIEALRAVVSHPVALEQCRNFVRSHPNIEPKEGHDTAGAVKLVVDAGDASIAAIGPALAAERYGATILERGVQEDPDNYTRFFLISSMMGARRNLGRLCLALDLPHESGSLHRALGIFAREGLNLRSLVARPRRGRPFEYTFYLEIDVPNKTELPQLECASSLLGWY